MTKIPSDDILEGLYELRIRESEKLTTVLELFNMEIHQKKAGLDYQRLKTRVKKCIEQNLRIKNFEARNRNYERNAVVKKIRRQNSVDKEFMEIVGNGKPTGSVLKEPIAVSVTMSISVQNRHSRILLRDLPCNRIREMRREPEVPEERVPVVECLDDPARITSKEVAPIHSVMNGILQNACSTSQKMDAYLVKSALMRIARLMNSPAKGPERMVSNTIERGDPLCATHQYHSTGNKFERFRGFLELISRFEFEFRRRENYFFERFEFLVRSCECAVACLCPRNSISNVVASVMIHDDIFF